MWDWIEKLVQLKKEGRPFVVATVVGCAGSTPREVGAKMVVLEDGSFFGTIGGGQLESLALEEAFQCFDSKISKMVKYPLCVRAGQCCGGSVDVFFEVNGIGPTLYLFGGGHVGQSLCKVLQGTPFTVHLIDERDEWIEAKELPPSIVRHKSSWKDFSDKAKWDAEHTYVAIMTFLHDMDLAIVADTMKRKTKYLGLIGSKTKWERFKLKLRAQDFADHQLARVHCPIGIDIGGKAPQEVAISIAAELLKTHYESTTATE